MSRLLLIARDDAADGIFFMIRDGIFFKGIFFKGICDGIFNGISTASTVSVVSPDASSRRSRSLRICACLWRASAAGAYPRLSLEFGPEGALVRVRARVRDRLGLGARVRVR
jgi:hypothetical protein